MLFEFIEFLGTKWPHVIEMIIMLKQTHFRVDKKEQAELSQPSPRLQKTLKSKDYHEFDSVKEGLDWLND